MTRLRNLHKMERPRLYDGAVCSPTNLRNEGRIGRNDYALHHNGAAAGESL